MVKVVRSVAKAIGAAQTAALEPAVVGPVLLALLKGPPVVRNALLRVLGPLSEEQKLVRLVKALKVLFALGIMKKANKLLNSLALNNWKMSAKKDEWVWKNEVAVVTGGCSGIGLKMVEALKRKGVKVAVVDVQQMPESLQNYRNIKFFQCDITDAAAFHDAAEAIRHSLGRPTILINNAGIGSPHSILKTTDEWLRKIFDVNIISHFTTVKEFLPDMVAKNKGHIVTIASMASFVSPGYIVDYAATKAGAHAFHEGLTQEIRHVHKAPNVLTTVVHPNWVNTPLVTNWKDQLEKAQGRLMSPERVANAVCDQVFSCRGGQLILPPQFSLASGIRGWPNWLQESLRDYMAKRGGDPTLAQP